MKNTKEFMTNFYKNNTKKRILIVCPYPKDQAAGQRLKYEQYIESWEENGFSVEISNFFNVSSYKILYKKGHYIKKIFAIVSGYLRRTKDIFLLPSFDIIYIHMWVTPLGTSFFERIFNALSKKIIYDIEDFITLKKNEYESFRELLISKVRSRQKFIFLIRNANHVITSSSDLNEDCKKRNKFANSTYISSSLDHKRFIPALRNQKKITIGWTGTYSSFKYFKLIEPILCSLKSKYNFHVTVIGNFEYANKNLDIEIIQWNLDSEIDDLSKIDIGIYPLDESEWVGGKSGLKAIQYMAMGIPFVASNLGINSKLFIDGESGFLASSDKEWAEKLSILLSDRDLRKSMGLNARMHFLNNYSHEHISSKYLKILTEQI